MTPRKRHDISKYRNLNRVQTDDKDKIKNTYRWLFVRGIRLSPVALPNKGPVTRDIGWDLQHKALGSFTSKIPFRYQTFGVAFIR